MRTECTGKDNNALCSSVHVVSWNYLAADPTSTHVQGARSSGLIPVQCWIAGMADSGTWRVV